MIYADNAATTRISDSVFEKMLPYLREQYGNASSQYSLGIDAKRAVEQARAQVASVIGAEQAEITFTSGGTETNTWVLRGVASMFKDEPVHIITTAIEHPSVISTCASLEADGADITYLPAGSDGYVLADDVITAIRPDTKLVSVMLANNETGTVQPIAEIGRFLRDQNILFHTDAVQAVAHIPVDVNDLHVDFLTASAHKFNGAKGIGFLYKRLGINLPPLIFGGGQENGLRSGTENVAGIVAAGYAIEESAAILDNEAVRLRALTCHTIEGIREKIPDVRINGDFERRLPGMINLGFNGVSGESMMHLLDLKGICVSTSSACYAGKGVSSHVLTALGQTGEQAKSAIRISYGRYNTIDEANTIVTAVCDAYCKLKA